MAPSPREGIRRSREKRARERTRSSDPASPPSVAGRGGRPVTWTGSPRWAAAPPRAESPGSRSSSSSPWRGRRSDRSVSAEAWQRARGAECRRHRRSGRRRPGRGTGSGHVPPECTARAAGRRTPRAPAARREGAAPVRGSGQRGQRESVERGPLLEMERMKGTLPAQGPGPEGGGEQTGGGGEGEGGDRFTGTRADGRMLEGQRSGRGEEYRIGSEK